MSDGGVRVEGLSKRYGDVRAVDSVTFAVRSGSVCGLLGPNGSGKTTTLRMLVGLVRPDAGTAWLLGHRVGPGSPVLARVGTLVEFPGFVPYLSGLANLRAYWLSGRGSAWPPPGLARALGAADLGEGLRRRVRTYSLGMRQRLGLAQALLADPGVLVLDEPANGLDPRQIRALRQALRELANEGCAVLMATHLLGEAQLLCDDVVVMDGGRLLWSGAVGDLLAGVRDRDPRMGLEDAYLQLLDGGESR